MIGRFVITDIAPRYYFGDEWLPVKAIEGEYIPIQATVTRDGHDALRVETVIYDSDKKVVAIYNMREIWPGTDRFEALVEFPKIGMHTYTIRAFDDVIGTWFHDSEIKIGANQDEELCLKTGIEIFNTALKDCVDLSEDDLKCVKNIIAMLKDKSLTAQVKFNKVNTAEINEIFHRNPIRNLLVESVPSEVNVERKLAGFGAWYEFFPRSEGATKDKAGNICSGTFKTAINSLQRVKDMGFDILYLPPIHPIGKTFRKGRNNTLTATSTDPGVPWAIGSSAGGHDAINPELGDIKDFGEFVKAANKLGIEIALDLALQASPDHPWVKQHPEWFTQRVDGTIAYAENPPKKYQDIYPINFDKDFDGLLKEVYRIVEYWISNGVNIFRVDNPHTKPVVFWQILIKKINKKYPKVIFLSESFTRPAMMHALGKAGFQQSYTYFTWRVNKWELINYGKEISCETSAFFRPNFWVNTPDILPFHLQNGEKNIFLIRALLAATLPPSWGMYAGYELCEHLPLAPSKEEYLDSEKYEIKIRNYEKARVEGTSIEKYIATLNNIRNENKAFSQLRTLVFHDTDSDQVIAYSKRSGDSVVLTVVNLNPSEPISTYVHWNLYYLNVNAQGADNEPQFKVKNLINGVTYNWQEHQHIELRPNVEVGIIGKIIL